jgi:hypothetical protein
MILDIIAYLIVLLAFIALGRNILSFFNLIGKEETYSTKCSGCSSGCDMKKTGPFVNNKQRSQNQYKFYL